MDGNAPVTRLAPEGPFEISLRADVQSQPSTPVNQRDPTLPATQSTQQDLSTASSDLDLKEVDANRVPYVVRIVNMILYATLY